MQAYIRLSMWITKVKGQESYIALNLNTIIKTTYTNIKLYKRNHNGSNTYHKEPKF